MKNISLVVATLSLFATTAAFACSGSPPPHCSCQGNHWVDDGSGDDHNHTPSNPVTNTNNNYNNTTNNNSYHTVNGVNGNVSSSATGGNATATGGTGVGIGVGGSVSNSGNSSIASGAVQNTVAGGAGGAGGSATATVAAGAVQNTVAGGSATATVAAGAVQNSNNNNATGGNATGGNATVAAGAVQNSTSASANGAGANNGNGSNNTNISYTNQAYRAPVNTAYAASLTSGMDTCLGSMSGGVQTQIFGLSIGGTHVDQNCILIKQTQLLREVGQERAACFRMQMGKTGEAIRQAMQDAGATCPSINPPAPVVVTKYVQGPERVIVKEVPATRIHE